MNKTLYLAFMLIASAANTQTIFQNTGNLRIHDEGQIGFYIDLINDGSFDENLGLVGFYGDHIRHIGGSLPSTLFDVEFMTENGTQIGTSLNVMNNANFILGNVVTPRTQPFVSLNFLANAFPSGEADIRKTDGYVSVHNQQVFTFPVGDFDQLRPLILKSKAINDFAKCAYFSEDPNAPKSLQGSFNTNAKANGIKKISTHEFWHLEGSVPSSIQLSWNDRSAMASLTDDVSKVIIVGWSKGKKQWENLGGSQSVGELTQGIALSATFIPDDYALLTFGTTGTASNVLDLGNYLVSPNGDGIDDFFEIPELKQSPNNHMMIFNRWGRKVFDKQNYTNQFNGFATEGNFLNNVKKGLPSGVYFYLVSLDDLGLEFQGFLYLANN